MHKKAVAAVALAAGLALGSPGAALADDSPDEGGDCTRAERDTQVELDDGTLLECQKDGRRRSVWVDVTPESDEDEEDTDEVNDDEEGSYRNTVVNFENTCDGVAGSIEFGDYPGEYRYSVWYDGELVAENAAGELDGVKPWDAVEAVDVRVTVDHKLDGGDYVNVVDVSHEYEAPETCDADPDPEPGNDCEQCDIESLVRALVDAGVITAESTVIVEVDGVRYECYIDDNGDVQYREVEDDEYNEDVCENGDVRYFRLVDGVWSEWTDCDEWVKLEDDDVNPSPSSSVSSSPDEQVTPVSNTGSNLPVTGATLVGLIAAAVAATGVGGAAIRLARNRRK